MTKEKWQAGSDFDTPGTIRTTMLKEALMYAARVYAQTKYPQPFENVYNVNGRQIEILVREKAQEAKP